MEINLYVVTRDIKYGHNTLHVFTMVYLNLEINNCYY